MRAGLAFVFILCMSFCFLTGCKPTGGESSKGDFYNDDNYVETNIDNMLELNTWYFTSGFPNNLITVYYENDEASIEMIADDGYFLSNGESKVIIEPNATVSWNPDVTDSSKTKTFICVMVTVDTNIVAYAVVGVYRQDGSWYNANAAILKSVFIENRSENSNIVSREYVNSLLETLKK